MPADICVPKVTSICCIRVGYSGGPTMSVIAECYPAVQVKVVDSIKTVLTPGMLLISAGSLGKSRCWIKCWLACGPQPSLLHR